MNDTHSTDSKLICQALEEFPVTLMQATPTLWALIYSHCAPLSKIKILCGGERLPVQLAESLSQQCRELWHVYGPSETCIWSMAQHFKSGHSLTLGTPIANTGIWVLDDKLEHCAIGQVGELYLSGQGLAKGYLNDSSTTANKFMSNPHALQGHERLYQTGDLVCYTAAEQLRFIGRIDNQVKVRGHRVELTEIEHQLLNQPGITQACVVLQQQQLHGFCVGEGFTRQALFTALQQELPNYMVPDLLTPLDTMPQTPAGKIDRIKLQRQTAQGTLNSTQAYIPYDAIEFQLKEVWEEVLQKTAISIDEDFFTIGGHSIIGVHLITKIEKQFNVTLSIAWLFQHRDIRTQAQYLRRHTHPHYHPILNFNPKPNEKPLVMIHPALTGGEVYSKFASLLDKSIPLYAIDSYNLNSKEPFIRSLDVLSARYVGYLRSIRPAGPYCLGGWSQGGIIAYEMAQILQAMGEEVTQVYLLDSHTFTSLALINAEESMTLELLQKELPQRRGYHLGNLPPAYLQWVLLSVRNDMSMLKNYRYRPYTGAVTLFKTTQHLTHAPNLVRKNSNGWSKYIDNLTIVPVNCHHYSLLEGEQVQTMTDYIRQDMLS